MKQMMNDDGMVEYTSNEINIGEIMEKIISDAETHDYGMEDLIDSAKIVAKAYHKMMLEDTLCDEYKCLLSSACGAVFMCIARNKYPNVIVEHILTREMCDAILEFCEEMIEKI